MDDEDCEHEDGRREYSDDEFLAAIAEGAETTSEIADHVGCTRQAADYRLRLLRQEGRVESRKIGRTLVWSLADDE